ncbi:MAG TPA: ABC transporter ATP-binding protein [Dongiaceae bacterium]|jgi:ATP-binding cassette subfamily B protein|nr:ABC transporter ATP-binding protein [Dongiaceae bacterium]
MKENNMLSADQPLRRLIAYSARYRSRMALGTLYSALNKLFDIAPEILIGGAVDIVVRRDRSVLGQWGFTDPFVQIAILTALTFFIWVFESLFEYLYKIVWRNLAQTIQHDLRMDAYRHVQRLGVGFFENKSTGALVAVMNDDINQLERFLDGGANTIVQIATGIVAIGAVFFYLAPEVALISTLPIPLILIGTFYFQKRAAPLYAAVRDKAGHLSARLNNNLLGIATIKSYVMEKEEARRLEEESHAYCAANAGAIRLGSAFVPIIRMAVLLGFIGTMLLGGWLAVKGELEAGSYSVLIFLTQRLLWPLTTLGETADLYQRAMASTRRVLDLLAVPPHDHKPGMPFEKQACKGELTFEAVSFSYPGRGQVIHDVSLHIPGGTSAAFIGTTGSGKSTLAKLLLRFYEPSGGRILLDGQPLDTFDVASLRKAIAYVSQDVFLFDGTIADNICYGVPHASQAEIQRAAQLAEAEEFIPHLPRGYDTQIGERGVKLSGGQRQRLSLARAILKNAPILILDEATSAVDNETEAAIQRSLEKVAVGRTTIIIAHRLTTIRNADQVFTLEDGRITERSTRLKQPAAL